MAGNRNSHARFVKADPIQHIPGIVSALHPFLAHIIQNLTESVVQSDQLPTLLRGAVVELTQSTFLGALTGIGVNFMPSLITGRIQEATNNVIKMIDEQFIQDVINEVRQEMQRHANHSNTELASLDALLTEYMKQITQWLAHNSNDKNASQSKYNQDFISFQQDLIQENPKFKILSASLTSAITAIFLDRKANILSIIKQILPNDPLGQLGVSAINEITTVAAVEKFTAKLSSGIFSALIETAKQTKPTQLNILGHNPLAQRYTEEINYAELRSKISILATVIVPSIRSSVLDTIDTISYKDLTEIQGKAIGLIDPSARLLQAAAKTFTSVKIAKMVIENIFGLLNQNNIAACLDQIPDAKIGNVFQLFEQFISNAVLNAANVNYKNDFQTLINVKQVIQELFSFLRELDRDTLAALVGKLTNSIGKTGAKIFMQALTTDNIHKLINIMELHLTNIIDPLTNTHRDNLAEFNQFLDDVCKIKFVDKRDPTSVEQEELKTRFMNLQEKNLTLCIELDDRAMQLTEAIAKEKNFILMLNDNVKQEQRASVLALLKSELFSIKAMKASIEMVNEVTLTETILMFPINMNYAKTVELDKVVNELSKIENNLSAYIEERKSKAQPDYKKMFVTTDEAWKERNKIKLEAAENLHQSLSSTLLIAKSIQKGRGDITELRNTVESLKNATTVSVESKKIEHKTLDEFTKKVTKATKSISVDYHDEEIATKHPNLKNTR